MEISWLRYYSSKLVQAKEWLHYNMAVSSEQHHFALESVEKFAGDFAAYLENPLVLTSLHPDGFESHIASTIVDEVKSGKMNTLHPETRFDGFPGIMMRYGNYDPLGFDLSQPPEGTNVVLGLRYNVEKCLPVMAYFFGFNFSRGKILSDTIDFLFSPTLITPQNIGDIIEKSVLKNTIITATQNRVLLEKNYPSKRLEETRQYYLLGQLESELIGKPLFVYGHNSKMTFAREKRAAAREYAPAHRLS